MLHRAIPVIARILDVSPLLPLPETALRWALAPLYPLISPVDATVPARIINHVFCAGFAYLRHVDLDVFYDKVSIMNPGAGPWEPE